MLNKTRGMILPGPEPTEWSFPGAEPGVWRHHSSTMAAENKPAAVNFCAACPPLRTLYLQQCQCHFQECCEVSCLQGLIHLYLLSCSEPRYGHIPEVVLMEGVAVTLKGPALCLQAAQRFFLYVSHSFLHEIINPCVI